ncbi:MAG TPA: hypothetical protein PLV25_04095 [Opitutales bacterium]|nr:hypothetical protein [Opitutales bacterium]
MKKEPHYHMHDLLFVVHRAQNRELVPNIGDMRAQVFKNSEDWLKDKKLGDLENIRKAADFFSEQKLLEQYLNLQRLLRTTREYCLEECNVIGATAWDVACFDVAFERIDRLFTPRSWAEYMERLDAVELIDNLLMEEDL